METEPIEKIRITPKFIPELLPLLGSLAISPIHVLLMCQLTLQSALFMLLGPLFFALCYLVSLYRNCIIVLPEGIQVKCWLKKRLILWKDIETIEAQKKFWFQYSRAMPIKWELPFWLYQRETEFKNSILKLAPPDHPFVQYYETDDIGRQAFFKSSKKQARFFYYLMILCLLIHLSGPLISPSAYFFKIHPQTVSALKKMNQGLDQYLERFVSEQTALSQKPFLKDFSLGADAGPFLNPLMSWSGQKDSYSGSLQIPDSIQDQLNQWEDEDFLNHASEVSYKNLDFSWMKKAMEFGYWDLESNSPIASLAKEAPDKDIYEYPELKLDFVGWAKLRFMKAAKEKDPLPALQEIHHLLKLLMTTESIHPFLQALCLSSLEAKAQDFFVQKKRLTSRENIPIPDDVKIMMRHSVVFSELFSVYTPPEVLRRLFIEETFSPLICVGVADAMKHIVYVEKYRGMYPTQIKILSEALEKKLSICRLKNLRRLWNDNSYQGIFHGGDRSYCRKNCLQTLFLIELVDIMTSHQNTLLNTYQK